jgi:superkiller protein 3
LLAALLLGLVLASCGAGPATPIPEDEAPTVAVESGTAEEHFQKGNEYAQQGQFQEAIDEYLAALEIEPEHVSALTNLGVAYYNTGRLQEAITQYEKAIAIAPEDADIYSNLGAAYVQTGQMEKALEQYQKAVELEPNLAQAHFGLGVIYAELDQTEEAIGAFERFQELDAGNDPIASDLANQYLEELRGQ